MSGAIEDVRRYYDETWVDYRVMWISRRDRALHFGYWDAETRTHSEALLNLNRELANRIGLQAGQKVLDAGCGVGGSCLWMAREHRVEALGITPVADQVRRARRDVQRQGSTAIFEEGDYTRTRFADGSFDVWWAMESLCHARDKGAVLHEAARVLRPGGRIGIVEYVRVARPLHAPHETHLLEWLRDWAIPDIDTLDEWRARLEREGFIDIEVTDITPNVTPSLRRLHRLAWLVRPIESLLHWLRLRTATQHANVRGSRRQWRALREGSWREVIVTATLCR